MSFVRLIEFCVIEFCTIEDFWAIEFRAIVIDEYSTIKF